MVNMHKTEHEIAPSRIEKRSGTTRTNALPPTYRHLIRANKESNATIADHHAGQADLALILHEGFLTPTALDARGRSTSRKGRDHSNFYHVEDIEVPRTAPPIPFNLVVVKLPKANWVVDEREAIPPEARHVGTPAFLQARIQAYKSIPPQRILALRLHYLPEHTIPAFEPIRSESVKAFLTSKEIGKLTQKDFQQKTDADLLAHLRKTIARTTRKPLAIHSKESSNGIEVKVPWLELAIATARKKGVPVYGWNGDLIE